MYLNDVLKQEECRNEALQELRKLNIKCRPKKPKQHNVKSGYKCFKVPLGILPTETVTLKTGQQIAVPKLVHQLCSFILAKVSTEGIFRKEGSRVRQGEMKLILNWGGVLDRNLHVIDIAALLKTFLRELIDPLIPIAYHELFLRSIILEQKYKLHALSLACLLLPLEHLNTLTYLMQFFNEVSQHSKRNKMDIYNLAVVIAPTIIPIEEKLNSQTVQMRTTKICEIIQVLIENSFEVGLIPESIIERLGSNASSEAKKKKRRSGSLTRMFNGLKKIVGGKSGEENNIVTPDLLLTPINTNAMKKRRTSNGVSNRRKKEPLNKFPDSDLLNSPFTPCRTPISMDLSGALDHAIKDANECHKGKKAPWFSRSKSVKNLTESDNSQFKHPIQKVINRRWSVISNSANIKKTKKRNSFTMVPQPLTAEPDYIRVSKVEYEDIKSRVTAMEKRISIELDTVQSRIKNDNENNTNIEVDVLNDVQTVYQQTLESNQLSPTTDQLAKRLSRELKIRRSSEQKIIRSPSARKIGSMRKKSLERNGPKIVRHQSWHLGVRDSSLRGSLKRGKPNTILTGLPSMETKELSKDVMCNVSGSSDTWVSAEGFFDTLASTKSESNILSDKSSDRASLAKLRCQNAGMVLAKAKLFDQLKDSSESSNSSLNKNFVRVGTKIGCNRKTDNRLSYRVRSLKYEDRKLARKSMSPRKRNGQLSQKAKLHIAKHYVVDSRTEKENIIPIRNCENIINFPVASPKTPLIKKTLNVKTPKRLVRTPVIERNTPLRALKTPGQHIV